MKITITLLENEMVSIESEYNGEIVEKTIPAYYLRPAIELITSAIIVSDIADAVEKEEKIQKEIDELTK